ncbi:Low affinity immunoglobulin epsilon Fc receptor [Fukomys damarensis]|nr:Low affinity immunoglobulin epsilon Fc receptor [Fukomys damarensis]
MQEGVRRAFVGAILIFGKRQYEEGEARHLLRRGRATGLPRFGRDSSSSGECTALCDCTALRDCTVLCDCTALCDCTCSVRDRVAVVIKVKATAGQGREAARQERDAEGPSFPTTPSAQNAPPAGTGSPMASEAARDSGSERAGPRTMIPEGPEPGEFFDLPRKRRCRRGLQLALLGLLTAALWAGLLTLLLLWHWDTLKSFKRLEVTAAQNVSRFSKELQRHHSEQMAQKTQAALMSQTVQELRAQQQQMKSQDSELSWNLDRLQEDMGSIKSQNLNQRRSALDSLGRLKEEVAKLWMEIQASRAVLAAELSLAMALTLTLRRLAMAPVAEAAPLGSWSYTMGSMTAPGKLARRIARQAPGSDCSTCPEQWVNFQQKCYYFGEGAKQWVQARFTCDDLEGRLVSIHSQEEQDFLTKHANKEGSWIGLRDLDVEGEFIWMDGSPVDYSNWQSGEPNNAQGEDCVMMQGSGKWNDAFCRSWLDAWVCEQLATCGSPTPSDATDDSRVSGLGSGSAHSP